MATLEARQELDALEAKLVNESYSQVDEEVMATDFADPFAEFLKTIQAELDCERRQETVEEQDAFIAAFARKFPGDLYGLTKLITHKHKLQAKQLEDLTMQERPGATSAPLERLRHHLQTRLPVLYTQILEPTLADLREEHSAALAEGRPWKARRVLLRGCGALAAAAVCQLGYSLLGRIAALWQARSPK